VRDPFAVVAPILCSLAFVSACSAPALTKYRPAGRILVVGDSLAVSPSDSDNFPAVLEARLRAAGLGWNVINAGVRGDTTSGGLRRINGLLASNRPDILILALGANDGLRGVDLKLMTQNLIGMISRAKAEKTQVLLCGMQLPPLNIFSYGRQFRDAFSDLADQHDVAFVPFLLEGVAMDPKMNGADGIHPNADGAKMIADTIWPYLDDLLRE
jgi:acyl-CoA thioesterase-1